MRRAPVGIALLVVGVVGACLGAGASCADATQVRLVLVGAPSLACTPAPLTAIYARAPGDAAGAPPQGTTRACVTGGRIGDVVFTPSDRGGDVLVQVEANLDGAEGCAPGNPRCIVARRRFAFVEHRSLELSVTIDPQCAGVVCKDDQTCYQGVCTSATVECSGSACTLPEERPDAGPTDAGAGSDAPIVLDASDAGGTFCGSGDNVIPDLADIVALVQGPDTVYYVTGAPGGVKAGRVGRLSLNRTRAERTVAEAPELDLAPGDDAYAWRPRTAKTPIQFTVLDPGSTPVSVPAGAPILFGIGPSAKSEGDVVIAEPKGLFAGADIYRGGSLRCSPLATPSRLLVTDAEELFFSNTALSRCDAGSVVAMSDVNTTPGATLTQAAVRTVGLGDGGLAETYIGWATATPNAVGYVRRTGGAVGKPRNPPNGEVIGVGLFRRGLVWAERKSALGGVQLSGIQYGIVPTLEVTDEGSLPGAPSAVLFLAPTLAHPAGCALWLDKGRIHTLALDRPGSVGSNP